MSQHISYEPSGSVSAAVDTRRSIRAFLPKAVPQEQIERILNLAARAPSGTNTQPWKTYVVTGGRRDQLCQLCSEAFDNPDLKPQSEVPYYPENWIEPFIGRRRQVGWALYGLLDIGKGDKERTHAQHRRNYQLFDAPVGLMFTINRSLATGSWLDYGMFLQNIMLLAREQGLHTCPQAAWADYHATVRQVLPITDDEILVCGMALGYADPSAIENTLVTPRVDLEENVSFFS